MRKFGVLRSIALPVLVVLAAAADVCADETDAAREAEAEAYFATHQTLEQRLEKERGWVGFYEWAGKVRIMGKKVEESPFSAESFSQWSDLVWVDPGWAGAKFEWWYGDKNGEVTSVRVQIYASPREAADRLMTYMWRTFATHSPDKRATEGELYVGDVAFPMHTSWAYPGALAFTRNNVAVLITAPDDEMGELAQFIDEKLVEALKPTDDPAFSNKPEDPSAEGEAKPQASEQSSSAVQTAADTRHEQRHEQWWAKARKRVDFDDWAGKVKITGKRVGKCPFDAASFRKWSGSVEERHLAKDSYFGWGADAEKSSILIYVWASPHEAADRLMYKLFTADWTRPGERITEGVLAVGDVAFPMISLSPRVPKNKLAFVRNNVAVVVTAPSRELLEELVAFVDGKLVEAMVPPDDPAFSNKLEEPPAQGEAQGESESENEEQAEK